MKNVLWKWKMFCENVFGKCFGKCFVNVLENGEKKKKHHNNFDILICWRHFLVFMFFSNTRLRILFISSSTNWFVEDIFWFLCFFRHKNDKISHFLFISKHFPISHFLFPEKHFPNYISQITFPEKHLSEFWYDALAPRANNMYYQWAPVCQKCTVKMCRHPVGLHLEMYPKPVPRVSNTVSPFP